MIPPAPPPAVVEDDHLDRVFSALSDRTRRALLRQLAAGSATVGELAAPHAMSLAAVSKHLGVLARAGLVTRTRDGRMRRCSLDPAALASAHAWLEHYRQFWDGSLASLAAFLEQVDPPETP